jgi:carbonic anhydrase/acetyltransferase-like protein (isoleucine patch superfamily)
MKKLIQKSFGLRKDVGLSFYLADFLCRKLMRLNGDTPWAVHFTSRVIAPEKISRGLEVYPGDSPGNYIEASNGIFIGDYTNIGPNVGIISANHNLVDNSVNDPAPPIRIGKFCWIGMNAVVLPGIELGDFTIVGAGSIVTRSFPGGYMVIGGNPALEIKKLNRAECDEFKRNKYAKQQ